MGISLVGILAILVMLVTILVSVNIIFRSNKLTGEMVPDELQALLPTSGATLVFFHAARCPPCRNMQTVVSDLHRKGIQTISIDVAKKPEITKKLGVRATPTCLIVIDNKIDHVVLGACTERKLAKLIRQPD